VDAGREEKSLNGFRMTGSSGNSFSSRGSLDQSEVLHCQLFDPPEFSLFFLFLIRQAVVFTTRIVSGCVSAGKFMFSQNVFDPIANRVLSHESEQSLWMLTPNCNFQF
jgi:hypothetical protein